MTLPKLWLRFGIGTFRCTSEPGPAPGLCLRKGRNPTAVPGLTGTFFLSCRWFCHVDDDNYLNPEALLSLLSGFPQDGDVYVGRPSLDKPITAHELMEGNETVRWPPLLAS